MKPSWDDAPEWAKYLAMDDNGEWFWFENEPDLEVRHWAAPGRFELSSITGPSWRYSLEQRPC